MASITSYCTYHVLSMLRVTTNVSCFYSLAPKKREENVNADLLSHPSPKTHVWGAQRTFLASYSPRPSLGSRTIKRAPAGKRRRQTPDTYKVRTGGNLEKWVACTRSRDLELLCFASNTQSPEKIEHQQVTKCTTVVHVMYLQLHLPFLILSYPHTMCVIHCHLCCYTCIPTGIQGRGN